MKSQSVAIQVLPLVLLANITTAHAADDPDPITHSFLATGSRTYIVEYSPGAAPAKPAPGRADKRPDILFENFEKATYEGWTATGTAFGDGPRLLKDMPKYQGNVNGVGKRVVNSHNTRNGEEVGQGDAHVGTLTSKSFKVERDYIAMRIGGGSHKGKTCVNLVVGGKVVASLTGRSQNRMADAAIDARKWVGKDAQLVLVDKHDKGWGNIGVDHIVFTDRKPAGSVPGAIDDGRRIVWQFPHSSRDGWVLPNGNVLLALSKSRKYPGGAVVEVTRDQPAKVVFEFKGTQAEVNTCQRLPNGNTMLTEAGPKPRILEVDPQGKVVAEVPMQCQLKNHHMQSRMTRKLANGNYLVPHLLDKVVREYDKTGKIVWEAATPNWAFTAIRLDNGNTLVGCTYGHTVVELDKTGKTVWQLTNKDLPQPLIKDACGVQRLPNGNTVITSYGARGPGEVKLFEVTRDKKLVWTHRTGFSGGVHHFQVLDTNGAKLAGSPLK